MRGGGAVEQGEQYGQRVALGGFEGLGEGIPRHGVGNGDEVGVVVEIGQAGGDFPRLAGAEDFAGAAEFKVAFRQVEAVFGIPQGLEALLGKGPKGLGIEEDAARGQGAASDPAAELMQLREAEAFRVFDDHDCGIRDIHADFDDRGGNQDGGAASFEVVHGGGFVLHLHAAVEEGDDARAIELLQPFGTLGGGGEVGFLVLFHQRADPVGLLAFRDDGFEARGDFREAVIRHDDGGDGRAAGGFGAECGDVHIPIGGEGEGARDGGGGHGEDVGGQGFRLRGAGEVDALLDAEAVLFVDDREAEAGEFDGVFREGVSADQQLHEAFRRVVFDTGFLRGGEAAGEECHGDAQRLEVFDGVGVELLGEDFGGGHEDALAAVLDNAQEGGEGHQGFAGADIALQEAQHGAGGGEVGIDFREGLLLAGGEGEGEGFGEFLAQIICRAVGDAGLGAGGGAGVLEGQLCGEEFIQCQALAGWVSGEEVGFGLGGVGGAQGVGKRKD